MDADTTASAAWSTPSGRRRSLAAIISLSLGVGLAFGMGYPLASLVLEQRGEPSWIIGLVGAAPSLAILMVLPLLPSAVRIVRPVTAILIGCVVSAVGYIALLFIDSAWTWIAVRFAMGAGLALPWLVGETWINHVAVDQSRTRVIAMYATAFFSGFAAGPIVLDVTGADASSTYLVGATGSLLAAIPILLARGLAPDLSHESTTGLLGGLRLAPAAMASSFLGGYLETTYFALLPNAALATGLDENTALKHLTVMLAGGLLTQYALGWVGDRTSRVGLLIALGVIFMSLAFVLPLVLGTGILSFATVFVLGAIVLGFYTLGLAVLGKEVDARDLATANAAFILMYTLGGIAGPAVTGVAMSMEPVMGFLASTALITLVLTALTRRAQLWHVHTRTP